MKYFLPKPYTKECISVRVDKEKLELINSLSVKFDMKRSEFINRYIDFSISQIKDKEKQILKNCHHI